jgi:small subunit ribosomal protein S4
MQLLEKQKARTIYGILEKQFRLYFERARHRQGDTGQILTELLERRLDNVVFRLRLAKSRSAARQAVTHGHVTVNGKRVNIPSFQVSTDDIVGVHERSRTSPLFRDYPQAVAQAQIPAWLAAEAGEFRGRVIRLPTTDDAPQPFQVRSIVEFYSR